MTKQQKVKLEKMKNIVHYYENICDEVVAIKKWDNNLYEQFYIGIRGGTTNQTVTYYKGFDYETKRPFNKLYTENI